MCFCVSTYMYICIYMLYSRHTNTSGNIIKDNNEKNTFLLIYLSSYSLKGQLFVIV